MHLANWPGYFPTANAEHQKVKVLSWQLLNTKICVSEHRNPNDMMRLVRGHTTYQQEHQSSGTLLSWHIPHHICTYHHHILSALQKSRKNIRTRFSKKNLQWKSKVPLSSSGISGRQLKHFCNSPHDLKHAESWHQECLMCWNIYKAIILAHFGFNKNKHLVHIEMLFHKFLHTTTVPIVQFYIYLNENLSNDNEQRILELTLIAPSAILFTRSASISLLKTVVWQHSCCAHEMDKCLLTCASLQQMHVQCVQICKLWIRIIVDGEHREGSPTFGDKPLPSDWTNE